jgi:methionyl-tRNA formyltransferase
MGTPEFAVPSLDMLARNGYNVVGVVTATDKMGGRAKKKRLESPVKKYALAHGIPLLQPTNLKSEEFQEQLRAWNADLQVVVAFRMLPEAVWNMPRIGTFNLHGSLLPQYRGAAPINWAIINGEKETGVTTFFIRHEIDTGDILLQDRLPIAPDETAGEVHDRMMHVGAELVLKTIQLIEADEYELKQQDHSQASKAPKIFHETCEIDFDQPTQTVHNFIRGLSPYPAAWTALDGKKLKILRTGMEVKPHDQPPGTFLSDNKNWIKVAAQDGFVWLHELQLQGRKRMMVKDFLNGYDFA